MKTGDVRITRLADEDGWLSVRGRYEALSRKLTCNPFMTWEFLHLNWRTFYPDTACWFIELDDSTGDTVGAGIFREYVHEDSRLKPKALRTIDHTYFMPINPLMYAAGRESEAYLCLAAARARITTATGADMFSLFRISDSTADVLARSFRMAGLHARIEQGIVSSRFDMACNLDDLCCRRKKQVRDARRVLRNTEKAFPGLVGFEHIKTWEVDDDLFETLILRQSAIEDRTWQSDFERTSEKVDAELTRRFNHESMRIWRRQGLLQLFFETIEGRDVSYFFMLENGSKTWAIKMGYDPDFKEYGVGKQVFLKVLEAVARREPGAVMELGGGAYEWKVRWAPDMFNLVKIDWALATHKGRVWELFQILRSFVAMFKKKGVAGPFVPTPSGHAECVGHQAGQGGAGNGKADSGNSVGVSEEDEENAAG